MTFVDCCEKTGARFATLIVNALNDFEIPLADCRGQGYGNAANRFGKYNGTQQHIIDLNPLCLFSPCGCHSINLCGADSAASCPDAITFFGMVATIYNVFSSSSKRWSILQEPIGSSLHALSGTRWTAWVVRHTIGIGKTPVAQSYAENKDIGEWCNHVRVIIYLYCYVGNLVEDPCRH